MNTTIVAGQNLKYTGERIIPGKTVDLIFREHEERYVFAGQYVSDKDVLDVACGTGVGTSFLKGAGARDVKGIDIDPDAIAFAKAAYEDCEFAQGDATALCLSDSSVDVVVSFETIEHVTDQHGFLLECCRVLRPGGVLICSTPNRRIFRWLADNPFHVRELFPMEFRDLVGSIFPTVELFGQSNQVYPLYIVRTTAGEALDRLRLKSTLKRILRGAPDANEFRTRFVNNTGALRGSVTPYCSNFLMQPAFLIAVARKAAV